MNLFSKFIALAFAPVLLWLLAFNGLSCITYEPEDPNAAKPKCDYWTTYDLYDAGDDQWKVRKIDATPVSEEYSFIFIEIRAGQYYESVSTHWIEAVEREDFDTIQDFGCGITDLRIYWSPEADRGNIRSNGYLGECHEGSCKGQHNLKRDNETIMGPE